MTNWRRACLALLAAALALLAGCASRPPVRDGVGASPPPNLERTPDAVPRVEPLREGGPNKPYDVAGRRYVPLTSDQPVNETGLASWYGRKFHGKPTSSGEPYDMYAMTAAHKTMPIPSYARVRNPANGREVVVRVNDRGPFEAGRVIDLSYTAALKLGVLNGVAPVEVRRLTWAEIRAGAGAPATGPGSVAAAVVAGPPLPPDDPPPGERPNVTDTPGWWVQLGAFRNREAALALQQRAQQQAVAEAALAPGVALFEEQALFRVQAGPYAGRAEALQAAAALQRLLGVPTLALPRGSSLTR